MRFVHCTKEEFLARCAAKKIICFGASRMPHEAAHELPVADRIECVLDNNAAGIGPEITLAGRSVPVRSPDWLRGRRFDKHAVLLTSRFYYDIFQQLQGVPELDDLECYAWPCLYLDDESTPEKKYESRVLTKSREFYQAFLAAGPLPPEEQADRFAAFRSRIERPGARILPAVVLLHSNICSLRCEDCCDLIPRVKRPYRLSPDEAARDLENLLRGLDLCVQVDLTDGEAFLYPDLAELIERVAAHPKVLIVEMVTNGTVMPSEDVLRALAHEKVFVNVSDYGFIAELGRLIHCFETRGIRFGVLSGLRWKRFGLPQRRREEREWLYYDFLRCLNKKCSKPLFRGRLYACMPAFRMADAGIFRSEKDSVALRAADSDADVAQKIRSVCMTDFIEACAWCRFCDESVPEIPPSGRERSAYTIIKKDKLRRLVSCLPGREWGRFV